MNPVDGDESDDNDRDCLQTDNDNKIGDDNIPSSQPAKKSLMLPMTNRAARPLEQMNADGQDDMEQASDVMGLVSNTECNFHHALTFKHFLAL